MDSKNIARHVTKIMLLIGFSPRLYGFGYLRDMVVVAMEAGERKLANIYPEVATRHGQPVDAVQTAVRTALKLAQEQSSFEKFEDVMGTKFIDPCYQLAPREFLGLMIEYLIYVWNGEERND